MKQVTVGMIGGGFAARLHGNAARMVSGVNIRLRTISDLIETAAVKTAEEFGFEQWTTDYNEILRDPEIDVVIICTPPVTHVTMVEEVLNSGKHVICEKPLSGYFGEDQEDRDDIGLRIPKRDMFRKVRGDMERLEAVVKNSRGRFMYAENYIYTPSIQRAAEFVRAKKSKITYLRGEESVQGSPTAGAGYWKNIGGGTLLRIGCHPLGGMLYLKSEEAKARGEVIRVESLVADTGMVNPHLEEAEKKHLRARPRDVEDFGTVTITFTDGTKATVFANDNVLGGIQNYLDVYCNDGTLRCRITPTDDLMTYYPEQEGLEDVYMSEALVEKTGWNYAFVSESVKRGYVAQLQDFMNCVAEDREPLSNFELARLTGEILYAAYISAEEGRRVYFSELETL